MTKKQMQCLLTYLGLDTGGIDGIWGPKSQAAARDFQTAQGLESHGGLDKATEAALLAAVTAQAAPEKDWWEDIRWFTKEEFACKCGKHCDGWPAQMDETLLRLADRVRAHFDAACLVSSGLRCPVHNANVGGAAASRHMQGKAMDFRIQGKPAGEVLDYVRIQPETRYAYAINGEYVHMDVN